MFRTMIAAAAVLTLAPAASAQTLELLTKEPWECRMTSLVGDPGGNLFISFAPDKALFATFYMEMTEGDDVIALEFDMSGGWSMAGDVVSSSMTGAQLINAWINNEELEYEALQEVGESLSAFEGLNGESRIAYIAEHAMVLDEVDTSISCWR